MEDYFYAGGLPVIVKEMDDQLHRNALTINGESIGDNCTSAICYNENVISSYEKPFQETAGIVILQGNLCPDGAVI